MPAKFEVCSFNPVGIISTYFQKFRVTLPWPRPLFENFLRDYVKTVPVNMPAKFEVRSFECVVSRQRWTQVRGPAIDRRQPLIS